MIDQKGMAPINFVVGIIAAIAFFIGGYYLGNLARPLFNKTSQLSLRPTTTPSEIPKPTISNVKSTSLSPQSTINPAPPPQPIPQSILPSDIPLFAGAKIAYITRMKSCGYQETSKFCEVNSFIYHITKPGLSVDEVLNWYVSNPNPSWVYGTPTFTQANSGKIVKEDTYFIIRIAGLNGTGNGVQLTFEGPYEQK